jgi:hypothetical protein
MVHSTFVAASTTGAHEEPLDVESVQWSRPTEDAVLASQYNGLEDYYSNITLTMTGDMNSKYLRCYTDHLMLAGGENFTDFAITVQSMTKKKKKKKQHSRSDLLKII